MSNTVTEKYVRRFTVELNPRLHASIRELARRKRVQIGVVYEEAIKRYLELPENYMGKDRMPKKGRFI